MEVGARDNGAAGVGGCGYARQGRLLLERWVMCTSARTRGRKEGSVCVCLGPTACDSATMTYASMGYGSMDRDKRKYGR